MKPSLSISLSILCIFLLLSLVWSSILNKPEYEAIRNIKPKVTPEVQAQTVKDLIARLIPERAAEFDVVVNPALSSDGVDIFKVSKIAGNPVVHITGSTGVAAAWGFHYYLTQYCNCHVSWDADQLQLPVVLPEVDITVESQDRFRYHQNVCTVSYSYAWWGWSRWEREIDWMALHGINLPLAFTGQEAIWQRVYQSLGLTQQQIDAHFSGPAFFAWQRMGNLRGWGGPLSSAWHEKTLALQHQILDRMRNFGMIPVLPAFAGHSPRGLAELFPDAQITQLTPWLGFEDQYCCPAFLQPMDPLFDTIGSAFIREMIAEFGTDHIYNCDIFNEMNPLETDPPYIAAVGQAVFRAMTQADSEAVWLMQGWLFYNAQSFWTRERAEALLTSVPLGKMIVLDLQAEIQPQYGRLDSYFGQPFIFCLLHNFGGTLGMCGALPKIAEGVVAARSYPNSTMIGTGLTMEGIHQNYVVYDHMLQMGWRKEAPQLNDWLNEYAARRYGSSSTSLNQAWNLLKRSVYNDTTGYSFSAQYVLVRRPALDRAPGLWYNPDDVILAWDQFIQVAVAFKEIATYRHDLVDLTRQALLETFNLLYSEAMVAYTDKDLPSFREASGKLIDTLTDMDTILQSSKNFLLGRWISDAKSWAVDQNEADQYEYNARNQITLWGPRGEILDYAAKQWAGLVSDYYQRRWELFVNELTTCLEQNVSFDQGLFNQHVFTQVEEAFTLGNNSYTDVPIGDSVTIALSLYDKWRPVYWQRKESASQKVLSFWRRTKTFQMGPWAETMLNE